MATTPIFDQPEDTAGITFSFLETKDLSALHGTCQFYKNMFRETLRKQKASKLLQHVFDADSKAVKGFLAKHCSFDLAKKTSSDTKATLETKAATEATSLEPKPSENPCIVLTKSSCKETYFSPSKDETLTRRTWKDISPLEAATWCGDIFILRELLAYIPASQQKIAIEQLQEMVHSRSDTAENGKFLAPFKALARAYLDYLNQVEALHKAGNEKEFERLGHQIWLCQRMLPTYGIQLYCDDKPFVGNTFEQEPKRSCFYLPWCQVDWDDPDLEDNEWALLKANMGENGGPGTFYSDPDGQEGWHIDFEAIRYLCYTREMQVQMLLQEMESHLSPEERNQLKMRTYVSKP